MLRHCVHGDFDEPDFSDPRRDEDRPDDFQECAVAGAFDHANPDETDADDDPQETFGPRLEKSEE